MTRSVPNHVAIILDGNRRWAKNNKRPVIEGHRQGAMNMRKILKFLKKEGVHTMTFWVFSTENWKRHKEQVSGLMKLFEEFANVYFKDAMEEELRVVHIGRKDRLSSSLLAKIEKYESETSHFKNNVLNIALDYGGQDEIIRAANKAGGDLTIDSFEDYLDTAGQKHPHPDMVIRTGGEKRLSGFMLWQTAYAELFFTETLLPDLSEDEVHGMLEEYSERHRRYGE